MFFSGLHCALDNLCKTEIIFPHSFFTNFQISYCYLKKKR